MASDEQLLLTEAITAAPSVLPPGLAELVRQLRHHLPAYGGAGVPRFAVDAARAVLAMSEPSPTVDREALVRLSAVALNGHVERYAMTRWDTTAERVVDALIAAGYVCTPGHEWQCPACGATTRARMADHPTEQDGAAQIAAERRRVVTAEGYDAAHDDQHTHGELLDAARCYANQGRTTFQPFTYKYGTDAGALLDQGWPWWTDDRPNGWKPSSNPVRSLVKAGQFIAAEIDRLVRAAGAS